MEYLKHCTRCPDSVHCCKNIRSLGLVGVSLDEAQRIREHTGKEFKEFLDFTPLAEDTIESCAEDEKGAEGELRMAQMDEGRILRLKTRANGDCVFLRGRQCTVYNARPGICRMYPFWYEGENGKITIKLYEKPSECAVSTACEKHIPLTKDEQETLIEEAEKLEAQRTFPKEKVRAFVKEHNISTL